MVNLQQVVWKRQCLLETKKNMDRKNIIVEVFKYFARFPQRRGVMANFISGKTPSTIELKDICQNLPQDRVIPELSDYVFGVNEDSVEKRIKAIKGIYLFIDYGNFTTNQDKNNVKTDQLRLGVTVAKPLNIATIDPVEEVILADELLTIMRTIRRQLIVDKDDPFVKLFTFPSEITPWYARELGNSVGWTMLFSLTGIDIL